MDLWLIRTQNNQIVGPYSRDRILEIIQSGTLSFRDELCRANDEWFFLNETEEVRQRLGKDVPELLRAALRKNSKLGVKGLGEGSSEDPTEEIESWEDDITEPGLDLDRSQLLNQSTNSSKANPWFNESNSRPQWVESTQVLKPGPAPRKEPLATELRPSAVEERSSSSPKIEVVGSSVPENSIFRALGLTLALLVLVIIYWVFRILRS